MVKFTRKARGHFVPLIQAVIHQITGISGLNLKKEIQGSREEQSNWVRELTTLSPYRLLGRCSTSFFEGTTH